MNDLAPKSYPLNPTYKSACTHRIHANTKHTQGHGGDGDNDDSNELLRKTG